jgi:hypothetical protein
MSRPHVVSHVGARTRPKVCWRIGCHELGSVASNARFYCQEHAPKPKTEVTIEHVQAARRMLARDQALASVAIELGVSRNELDVALWRYIDLPLGRQPEAMF